jgi:hypothetical protein
MLHRFYESVIFEMLALFHTKIKQNHQLHQKASSCHFEATSTQGIHHQFRTAQLEKRKKAK